MDHPAIERVAALSGRFAAPAKINLALHVTGRRENGYHDLDSLVVFAEVGDLLHVAPSTADRLTIEGPFAAGLPTDRGNLVLRALDTARRVARAAGVDLAPVHLHLDKRLPLASGIGGGSADGAALLRAVADRHPALRDALLRESLALGADVPMCLTGRAARVSGLGEVSAPLARLPALAMVLVNCGTAVSTPLAFAALARRDNAPLPPVPPGGFAELRALAAYLARTRNDLEAPALSLAPAIGEAVSLLRARGAAFCRMSGSGATVFALFETSREAEDAARAVAGHRPGWWVAATKTLPAGDEPR